MRKTNVNYLIAGTTSSNSKCRYIDQLLTFIVAIWCESNDEFCICFQLNGSPCGLTVILNVFMIEMAHDQNYI